MSVLDSIARDLAAAGLGAYSPDAPLPAGQTPITLIGWPSHAGPAVALAIYPGGPEPDSRNGWEYPRLQVKVRHTDPLAAVALDQAAYDALQFRADGTVHARTLPGGQWLDDCYALQSTAESLGRDANGHWEFVRNYQLTIDPTT